ncbi:MAG: polysaccharide biosynthesis protein [Firmicutes bacterium]|nr:polysaccharide biosynthesis protein [Bacillota bacterium]
MENLIEGKKILITGGTGTLGQALARKIIQYRPEVVRIFSRDEAKQFELQDEFSSFRNIRFLLGDIRDKERVDRSMEGIDIVFHFAALKHVPACEYNPFEAIKTNILGTQNIIDTAMKHNVGRVIYTSSDKAISPTNTMGASKLLAERLISAADYYKGKISTIFTAVRFGNVMGSRGSVIPFFKKQVSRGGPVTVTKPEMSRFMMSISDALNLTLQAGEKSLGGEVFILKMPVIRLIDLAEIIIEEFAPSCGYSPQDIKIKVIGLRPGEKMYEELMTEEEAKIAVEFNDMFAVVPTYAERKYEYPGGRSVNRGTYSSHEIEPLDKKQLRELLYRENLLARRKKQ